MSEFRNKIITISGDPGSGKNTIANKLKESYEEKGNKVYVFSMGDEARKIAQKRGVSIEKLNSDMVEEKIIDELLDSKVSELGKKINSKERQNVVYIFVSRTAGKLIEGAFTVRTTVDENVAAKRIFEDITRGEEDKYANIEDAKKAIISRKQKEIDRFLKIYNFNLQNPDNYKLVIDTSYSTIEDIAKVIEQCLELELERKDYGKMWTSPKKLLPLQYETDTIGASAESGLTLEEWIEKLKKEGYNPALPVSVIKVKDKYINLNGNHRNIASHIIGNTLVPYTIIAKDAEVIPGSNGKTAEEEALALNKNMLFGHEQFFDEPGQQFSYNHIYPGIYHELNKKELEER